MYNCAHCGSPINGKFTLVTYKDKHKTLHFHENPTDCYITAEPKYHKPSMSFAYTNLLIEYGI